MKDLTRARAMAHEMIKAYGDDSQSDVFMACVMLLQAIVAQMDEPNATQCCKYAYNVIAAPLAARLAAARPAGVA